MTTQKSFKRRVRERMAKTGESYTAARAQLIPQAPTDPAPAPEPPARVQEVTGRSHDEWFAQLDAAGAAGMTHAQIARWLVGERDVPGWWAQNITVEYERARGRRAVNQNATGFYASVSKTVRRPAAEVYAEVEARLEAWQLTRRPSRARLVVRADATEGRPVITVVDKGDRCTVAVQHERLPDADAVARWKVVWRERLAELAAQPRP